jgi:hypothetical protein
MLAPSTREQSYLILSPFCLRQTNRTCTTICRRNWRLYLDGKCRYILLRGPFGTWSSFRCSKSTTRVKQLKVPPGGLDPWIFPTSAWFEPASLGSWGGNVTSRPRRPLRYPWSHRENKQISRNEILDYVRNFLRFSPETVAVESTEWNQNWCDIFTKILLLYWRHIVNKPTLRSQISGDIYAKFFPVITEVIIVMKRQYVTRPQVADLVNFLLSLKTQWQWTESKKH